MQDNVQQAIFAYNHLESYVQAVLSYASTYARGGFTVSPVTLDARASAAASAPALDADDAQRGVATVITSPTAARQAVPVGRHRAGRVRLLGPGHDGLPGGRHRHPADLGGPVVVGAPRARRQVEPGDLVFFAGADGTQTSPGHVGLVIGGGKMIEAYATGFPIRISTFGSPTSQPGLSQVVGFARPWAQPGLNLGNSARG